MDHIVPHSDIRGEGNETTHDIGGCDGSGAAAGPGGVGLFKAKLETHHEIDPAVLIRADCIDYRAHLLVVQAVIAKHLYYFELLLVGNFLAFEVLAFLFRGVMFGVRFGGKIPPEAHGNRASGNFRKAGGDDDSSSSCGDRSGEARGEREGHGQAVGHSNDNVAHGGGGGEMLFGMLHRLSPAFPGANPMRCRTSTVKSLEGVYL